MSYITGMKLTANDTVPQFKLGAIGQDSNGYLYKYVKYNSGAGPVAAVAGNTVGYYAPGGTGAGSTDVTSDVSDTAGVSAGVLQAVLGNGEYGWIQIKGKATLNLAFVSGADGNLMRLSSTTDGAAKVAAAVTDSPLGVALYATGKIVMLDCPL